jgi:hypothetical protein
MSRDEGEAKNLEAVVSNVSIVDSSVAEFTLSQPKDSLRITSFLLSHSVGEEELGGEGPGGSVK